MPTNSKYLDVVITQPSDHTAPMRRLAPAPAPAPAQGEKQPHATYQVPENHNGRRSKSEFLASGITGMAGEKPTLQSLCNSEDVICLQVELSQQIENSRALQIQYLQTQEANKQVEALNKSLIYEVQQCHEQLQQLSTQNQNLVSLTGSLSDEITALRSQIANGVWHKHQNTEAAQKRQLAYDAYRLKVTEVEKLRKKTYDQDNQIMKASVHLDEFSREIRNLKSHYRQALEQIESLQWHEKMLLDHIRLLENESNSDVEQKRDPTPDGDIELDTYLTTDRVLNQNADGEYVSDCPTIAMDAEPTVSRDEKHT
ncbi:hypothetical protein TWF718_009707 [Orbilia javanica]|uniref:Uncharacterized protein n=1 Tax=Orbilia javanica TaxID=47235 RepID=A0AAN8MKL7_9PEZI